MIILNYLTFESVDQTGTQHQKERNCKRCTAISIC